MKNLSNRKGFTLIELILVVLIIAFIAAVAVPRVFGFAARARIAADQASVATLNSATRLFRITVSSTDPFEDEGKSGEELMGALVGGGYLASVVEPQSEDAEFAWLMDKEKWYLLFEDSFYVVSLSDGISITNDGYFEGRLHNKYTGSSKDIVIPHELDGTVVNSIWQDVFKESGLIAVAFEEDSEIVQIHARAFEDNELTQIDFPDTLKRIDLRAFKNNGLTEINLPLGLEKVEWRAFYGNDLNKITIGPNVNSIGDEAFGDCTDKFKTAYEAGGKGTYIFDGENWKKD